MPKENFIAAGLTEAMKITALLRAVPSGRWAEPREISAAMDRAGVPVSARSLQRALRTLSLSTLFPVEVDDTGNPYRYRWKPGAERITMPSPDAAERVLLALAADFFRQALPPETGKRLAALLIGPKDPLSGRAVFVPGTLPRVPARIPPLALEAAARACEAGTLLRAKVRVGRRTEDALYAVLGFFAEEGSLWAVLLKKGEAAPEAHALARIIEARATSFAAEAPEAFTLRGWIEGRRPAPPLCRLELVLGEGPALRSLRDAPLAKNQKVARLGGKEALFKVSAELPDTPGLDAWLRARRDDFASVLKAPAEAKEPDAF
jgi:hypothetical protein